MTPGLGTYLHDHLSGAEAATMLIDRLVELEPARCAWLMRMRNELEADRLVLIDIMQRLEIDNIAAAEVPHLTDRPSSRLEALEKLALRVLAKHKLWVTLTAVVRDYPPLQEFDFDRLRARAIEQHALFEQERLAAALLPLGSARRRSA